MTQPAETTYCWLSYSRGERNQSLPFHSYLSIVPSNLSSPMRRDLCQQTMLIMVGEDTLFTPLLLWRTSTIKALTISAQFLVQQLHSVTVTEYSYISVQQWQLNLGYDSYNNLVIVIYLVQLLTQPGPSCMSSTSTQLPKCQVHPVVCTV